MLYPFRKYPDKTEVLFSDIKKDDCDNEVLYVYFERPTENGFDSVKFELPSYNIVHSEGNYTKTEIEFFKQVVEHSAASFFKYARVGGVGNA